MAERQAIVVIHNATGMIIKFQLNHQYTGEAIETSDWIELKDGEERIVLTVHYCTGWDTTGVDNWTLNGIERRELNGSLRLPVVTYRIAGQSYFDLRYSSGTGFLSGWKVHTLRNADADKTTTIWVFPTRTEFRSESGKSETSWNPEFQFSDKHNLGGHVMSTESTRHPLEYYPENEQVAYLSILASICYADKEFSVPEKQQLDAFLTTMNISDEGKGKVYASVFNLQHEQKRSFLGIIHDLNDTDLKFTLISDLCLFALADSTFSPAEYDYIVEVGDHLHITREQVEAIRSIQENLWKIKDIPPTSETAKNILKEGAAGLAGVGVPVSAIAVSGSVFGLSAAGITSGLAALGALVGGGMIAGAVLVVPAIAAGTVYGVKKLFDLIW